MSGPRREAGQLGPQVEGYQAWLTRRGYTPGTVRHMLKDLGQVGLWLSTEGLGAAQLDEQRMAAFLTARQVKGYRQVPGARAMVLLLSFLREAGVVPAAEPLLSPVGALLAQYRFWMVQERGLAPTRSVGPAKNRMVVAQRPSIAARWQRAARSAAVVT